MFMQRYLVVVSLLFLYIIFWLTIYLKSAFFHLRRERKMLGNCIENVRKNVPLVHNITNYVTVNDVANVLLACGGSPIMSDEPEDVVDITSICGGLNINIGTLNQRSIEGMLLAGKKANELGHKVLLDPVGAGASALRTNTAMKIMNEIRLDVIRGNISEIKTLALGSGTTKGVDADAADAVTEDNLDQMTAFAKSFAKESGSIVAITGAIDLVADADTCYVIRNGRPEMGKITGTGCQLSGMMTAFLVANPDHMLEAAAAAVCTMGTAGEIAWKRMSEGDGNSTYRNRIIDAIYHMDGETLDREAKYEVR
jgi:hydroxyethylthiazole kinase